LDGIERLWDYQDNRFGENLWVHKKWRPQGHEEDWFLVPWCCYVHFFFESNVVMYMNNTNIDSHLTSIKIGSLSYHIHHWIEITSIFIFLCGVRIVEYGTSILYSAYIYFWETWNILGELLTSQIPPCLFFLDKIPTLSY